MELENAMISSSSSSSAGSREYKVVMLGAGGVGKSGNMLKMKIGSDFDDEEGVTKKSKEKISKKQSKQFVWETLTDINN